jgi:predicted transcriptional regulator
MSPRTGRPKSDNPLNNDVKVRLDNEVHKRLLDYCRKNNTTKAVVIRNAIVQFLDANM